MFSIHHGNISSTCLWYCLVLICALLHRSWAKKKHGLREQSASRWKQWNLRSICWPRSNYTPEQQYMGCDRHFVLISIHQIFNKWVMFGLLINSHRLKEKKKKSNITSNYLTYCSKMRQGRPALLYNVRTQIFTMSSNTSSSTSNESCCCFFTLASREIFNKTPQSAIINSWHYTVCKGRFYFPPPPPCSFCLIPTFLCNFTPMKTFFTEMNFPLMSTSDLISYMFSIPPNSHMHLHFAEHCQN